VKRAPMGSATTQHKTRQRRTAPAHPCRDRTGSPVQGARWPTPAKARAVALASARTADAAGRAPAPVALAPDRAGALAHSVTPATRKKKPWKASGVASYAPP
jgi:hypothetical protein